jgi:hypothetical protein
MSLQTFVKEYSAMEAMADLLEIVKNFRSTTSVDWVIDVIHVCSQKLSFHFAFNITNLGTYSIRFLYTICLAYNEFAYKKIKNDCKLGDTF